MNHDRDQIIIREKRINMNTYFKIKSTKYQKRSIGVLDKFKLEKIK